MVDVNSLLDKREFAAFEPEHKQILKNIIEETNGKSTLDMMKILVSYSKSMPKANYTKEQKQEMITAILDSIPEGERASYVNVIKVLNFA